MNTARDEPRPSDAGWPPEEPLPEATPQDSAAVRMAVCFDPNPAAAAEEHARRRAAAAWERSSFELAQMKERSN